MQQTKSSLILIIALFITQWAMCQEGNSLDQITKRLLPYSIVFDSIEIQDNKAVNSLLDKIVKESTIVCLGESRHDIHEQFVLKYHIVKALVKDHGFKTFILEASLPYAEQINAYIQNGVGDLQSLLSNMPGASLWDKKEMYTILQWMHDYNTNHVGSDALSFKGIDIIAPEYGVHSVLNFIEYLDPEYSKKYNQTNFGLEQIEDNNWPQSMERISQLSEEQQEKLRDNYNSLFQHVSNNKRNYVRLSSKSEYDRIYRFAYCAKEAIRMFTANTNLEKGLIRESAMANNAKWASQNGSTYSKSIIWAHNVHITKGEFYMTGYTERIKGMGYILGQEYGSQMVSIGASYNRGEFVEQGRIFPPADKKSFEGKIALMNRNFAIIDLKNASHDEVLNKWLSSLHSIRGQEFEMSFIPNQSFDAIYYVNRISMVKEN